MDNENDDDKFLEVQIYPYKNHDKFLKELDKIIDFVFDIDNKLYDEYGVIFGFMKSEDVEKITNNFYEFLLYKIFINNSEKYTNFHL